MVFEFIENEIGIPPKREGGNTSLAEIENVSYTSTVCIGEDNDEATYG